jgi:hypothetical protein
LTAKANGKAETVHPHPPSRLGLRPIYRSSTERSAALGGWVDWTTPDDPHSALSHKPPIARLNELNNLLGSYI